MDVPIEFLVFWSGDPISMGRCPGWNPLGSVPYAQDDPAKQLFNREPSPSPDCLRPTISGGEWVGDSMTKDMTSVKDLRAHAEILLELGMMPSLERLLALLSRPTAH